MKKPLIAIVMAGAIICATLSSSTNAEARRGWWGPALGGFAAGAIIASAFARPYYGYGYGYGYPYRYASYGYPYSYGYSYYRPAYYGYYRPAYYGYYRPAYSFGYYRPAYRRAYYGFYGRRGRW